MSTRINTKTTGSYSFQNAFFYLQWPDDSYVLKSERATEAGLITLRKTRRRAKLHPHKQRSKYICRPDHVIEAGNHFIWEFIPGHGTVNVPPEAAILHHYRVCEFGGDDCIKSQSVVDRTAYKYLYRLADAVERMWNELAAKCPLPDLELNLSSPRRLQNYFQPTPSRGCNDKVVHHFVIALLFCSVLVNLMTEF